LLQRKNRLFAGVFQIGRIARLSGALRWIVRRTVALGATAGGITTALRCTVFAPATLRPGRTAARFVCGVLAFPIR
jgi:hypothetical protein